MEEGRRAWLNGGNSLGGDNAPGRSSARVGRRTDQQRRRRVQVRQARTAPELASTSDRRNEHQRQRRAQSRQASRAASTPRVSRTRRAESEDARAVRLAKRRDETRRRTALKRAKEKEILEDLVSRVLSANNLTQEEVAWMGEKQRFLDDPRLALAYFYCCGTDPESFVFGDEQIRGENGRATRDRITGLFADYPQATDIGNCQRLVLAKAAEATSLWACASCGRVLMENTSGNVFFSALEDLNSVRLTEQERVQCFSDTPEPIARLYRQLYFFESDIYYLIPELVRDHKRIPLCQKCYKDPRKNKFSVASGHDYGRIGQLPFLNETALSCITPVRCFGLELSLSGKHSTGHAICFPSNGPAELARVLPRTDDGCIPRVTFIGPRETWKIQQKRFSKMYTIPVNDIYKWLVVLASTNNIFKEEGIEIEDNPKRRELLRNMEQHILESVQVSDSDIAASFDDIAVDTTALGVAAVDSSEEVFVRRSAVLPPVEQCDISVTHEIVDAMIAAVGPSSAPADATDPSRSVEPPVVPIKRGRSPLVEWTDNAKMLASAFPTLFLTGSGPLPSGSLPREYVDHFMNYWDGRFESSVAFTTVLFNQMQRHAALQKAARVGTTHAKTMTKFGKLVSTEKFKQALEFAKLHPDSKEAVRMNAGLLRLLSLVGGTVPFSPFERATTRPKLGAMRYRYGIALHWVTLAPPEHDDLLLHRVAQLREQGAWNDEQSIYSQKNCRFSDFPVALRTSARARLAISATYPALSAQVFERRFTSLTNDIIRCSESSATRASTNYLNAECGVFGKCAAFNAVIEPQGDGRLHDHMTVYGPSVNPTLLSRASCCPELHESVRRYLDNVCCTTTSNEIQEWSQSMQETCDGKMPRAFEIDVPNAADDYEGFMLAAEKMVASTNTHSHSATCRKGIRGRHICRLARPSGIHDDETQPLCIRLKTPSNLGKRKRAEFCVSAVINAVADCIDAKMDYANKRIVRDHTNGAVIWEQRRPPRDAMFAETNLALACLSCSHTNSAIMNGEDAGDMVEEYQQSYMTKEKGGLKHATAAMHTAVGHILKFPSVADDCGTDLRTAKHLAARTVNAFSGAYEWSHSLMAYALTGHRSYVSSDTFWYVFPHKMVEYVEAALENKGSDLILPGPESIESDKLGTSDSDGEDISVHEELDDIVAAADDLGVLKASSSTNAGARMFRFDDGKIVLVTQAESYKHRGELFAAYSPLEFEMIVDILPRSHSEMRDPSQRGRPKRKGFDLGTGHPLAPHYQAYIRAKFKTPMLGGAPPPPLKNGKPSIGLSKYLLCLLTPWTDDSLPLQGSARQRLLSLCKDWNRRSSSFINRQRYQYLHNILKKRSRSSTNEKACSEWRSRNADFWNEGTQPPPPNASFGREDPDAVDGEAAGILSVSAEELFRLTTAATAKHRSAVEAVKALKADFWSLVPENVGGSGRAVPQHAPIFQVDGINLSRISRSIHTMRQVVDTTPTISTEDDDVSGHGPNDTLRLSPQDEAARNACSPDQRDVFDLLFQSLDGGRRLRQNLVLLHGGGGTGKSTLLRRIASTLKHRGIKTVNTCPTGVGASLLEDGQTVHSAFKTLRDTLTPNDLALLRLTFTDQVWLIVVDEVSMLSAKYLVLLDTRLRAIYHSNLPFGGRTVILSGDFLQLKVPSGLPICQAFYAESRKSVVMSARALFRRFKAFFFEPPTSRCELFNPES